MEQNKFIYFLKYQLDQNVDIQQLDNGITYAMIRPNVKIVHNYKKKIPISIEFTDIGMEYEIQYQSQLLEIVEMHLNNVHINQILTEYCKKNLSEIKS